MGLRDLPKSFANLIQPGLRPVRSPFCTCDAELSTINSQRGLCAWSVRAGPWETQTHQECPPGRTSPLECALTRHGQGPVNPLESALTRLVGLKSFGFCTYVKRGGGGSQE